MIDREHDLAVVCEAKVLTLARSNKPRPVSVEDLALMRRLDELHLDYPFAGARMLRDLLRREGVPVGWRHVATLMKREGARRDLPASEHEQAGAGAQDLSVSAARAED